MARGDDGQAFIRDLAAATGSEVAASTDATGAAARGGDWTLETATGPIEAAPLAGDAYPDLLAMPFTSQTTYATANFPSSVAVGDLNGDGKLDVVSANGSDNAVSVLLGNGDGTFQAKLSFNAGGSLHAAALADLNGDHELDLVVANTDNKTVGILLNAIPNAAPTIGAGADTLAGTPDTTASGAVRVSTLLALGSGYADSFGADPRGIALTSTTLAGSGGSWQWSANGSTNWTDFSVSAASSAIVLDSGAYIRFNLASGQDGTAGFTWKGWDETDGKTNGQTDSATTVGGASAFSVNSRAATLAVSTTIHVPTNNIQPSPAPAPAPALVLAPAPAGDTGVSTSVPITSQAGPTFTGFVYSHSGVSYESEMTPAGVLSYRLTVSARPPKPGVATGWFDQPLR